MNENELQDALKDLLEEISAMQADQREEAGFDDDWTDIDRVRTYEEAGLLTTDAGLVITLAGGIEFQVTIKRSR